MDDVAAMAGVSRGTVSRALSGGKKVSARSMQAIRQAVDQTGYVVNRHARSLATQRSQSVAFVLRASQQRLGEDPSFNLLLASCTQSLAAHGITVALVLAGSASDRRRARDYLTSGYVDGALIVSATPDDPVASELAGLGLPVVVSGVAPGPEPGMSYVSTDDRGGARKMVRYLRGTGRRRIAAIAGPPGTTYGAERLAGWREVMDKPSDRLVAVGDYTCAGGRAAMDRLLATAPELDAVFVASDLMAAGALAALAQAGRRVPEEVAVGGFEDSAVATTVAPALTTVRRPLALVSAEMVRLLLAQIECGTTAEVVLPTELVIRDSA